MLQRSAALMSLVFALSVMVSLPAGAAPAQEPFRLASNHADHVEQTVLDVAVAAGSFKTLVAAIQAAELVDSVNSPGPLTVFAPTDEAFAKLPAGTVESLLKPENRAKLVRILTYHVVPGQYTLSEVFEQTMLPTAAGKAMTVKKGNGGTVGGAKILKKDILGSNGVIHVIDRVLLP